MTKEEAKKRAKELVSRMTVEEKASQLLFDSPAIERLGIREYNWWNESSHGVARAGTATVFPHAIALAASFDPTLVRRVADVISTEGRVKYNEHCRHGDHDIYKGLTFWAPNINIFRDPRWGRGQETFGEDPFLTAALAVAYIAGLQGRCDETHFLKASACSKHFAVHSGPEAERHSFDAKTDLHDLYETYLPAFEKTVGSGVTGVMGAYNRTNGEPCCTHSYLLKKVLRGDWGFDGYITSDCGALKDIFNGHHAAETETEAAAMALKATVDLNCGSVYRSLTDAYEEDRITEEDITRAAEQVYTIRFLLGEFEKERPYADLGYELLDCKKHRNLNLKAAEESLVLLKNENGFLPLFQTPKRIAVVGPNANSRLALEGNYNGRAGEYITVADGIRRVFPRAEISVEEGSQICRRKKTDWSGFGNMESDGVAAAAYADLTVLVLGLDRTAEGEEMGSENEFFYRGDKRTLYLPKTQIDLAEKVCDACENVIAVLMCGSAVDPGEKLRRCAKAIIYAFYPGAVGGLAVAKLIKGGFSPSGKLPVTLYAGDYPLPDFTDYSMKGRTYRYMEGTPLYPFGFGLSYSRVEIKSAGILSVTGRKIILTVSLKNTGLKTTAEKVQVYGRYEDSETPTPHFQLCSVKPVFLRAGEEKTIKTEIDRYWLKAVSKDGTRVEPDTSLSLFVGTHQPDEKSTELTGTPCIELKIR